MAGMRSPELRLAASSVRTSRQTPTKNLDVQGGGETQEGAHKHDQAISCVLGLPGRHEKSQDQGKAEVGVQMEGLLLHHHKHVEQVIGRHEKPGDQDGDPYRFFHHAYTP
jgi:hypothetical protein